MKKKECERLAYETKMTPAQLESVSRRTDVVSYALLAEIDHFYSDSAGEVTKSLKNFMQQQLQFYKNVGTTIKHNCNHHLRIIIIIIINPSGRVRYY